jgi:hypothetical protein
MAALEWTPLQRCCPQHDDYVVLAAHLVEDFRELPPPDVARQLVAARSAVEPFRMPAADDISMVELICRYQLSYLAGRFEEVARLDPQNHQARRRSDAAARAPFRQGA